MKKTQVLLLALVALISGLIGGMAAGQLAGATEEKAQVLSAQEFRVVDDQGRIRGMLGVNQQGVSLALYSQKGVHRLAVQVSGAEPNLSLYDDKGKVRAVLWLSGQVPQLVLFDAAEGRRAVMEVVQPGPRLSLLDKQHKVRAVLGAAEFKHPSTGKEMQQAESSLMMFNASGRVLWSAP
ncbi:MAG: hypothetical protein PVG03_17645 [Desulfarculaceae bacterium]|jgi:hypothetical protein